MFYLSMSWFQFFKLQLMRKSRHHGKSGAAEVLAREEPSACINQYV